MVPRVPPGNEYLSVGWADGWLGFCSAWSCWLFASFECHQTLVPGFCSRSPVSWSCRMWDESRICSATARPTFAQRRSDPTSTNCRMLRINYASGRSSWKYRIRRSHTARRWVLERDEVWLLKKLAHKLNIITWCNKCGVWTYNQSWNIVCFSN